jgi:cytochrome P450
MKLEWILVFSRYNESFRQSRKLLDRSLRPATLASYRPMLEARTHNFLAQVLANPDELEAHLHQFVGILWCYRFH